MHQPKHIFGRLLHIIQEKGQNLQLQFEPETVVGDFEVAIKQAIQLNFPTSTYQGCYYHFCQAIMRKIKDIGLQIQYKENTEQLKSFVRRTAALAFAPIRFVRLAWQGIKADTPELPRIDEFVMYFETTWIAGTFHTSEWETEGPRTNNHLEGWHNRLRRVVGKYHPNIFECVEVFQREQVSTEARF